MSLKGEMRKRNKIMNRHQKIIVRKYKKEIKNNWKYYIGVFLFAVFFVTALGLAGKADYQACLRDMC